ncbi:protein YIPF1 [Diaphorina citri]|uniref:Protein YIPF n=1 Tax=Diaphorina citri TaxID=121845 RepID=A0A3Q0JAC3_DIACI|nr:protein YIPF1 [Diaphorina citri]
MSTDILVDFEETNASEFDFKSYPSQLEQNPLGDSPVRNSQKQDAFPGDDSSKPSQWSFEYFQRFFDVDTDTVISRIKGSVYPKFGDNYLQTYIQSKPDLYGPFWVCVTLIITIAISGNIANYLQAAATHKYHWKYDFHAISTSATAIFSYAWLLPVLVWGYLKYQNDSEVVNLSILELLCVYGYSLSIYIPIAILWVIQVGFLQVTLVLIGALLSGYILITSLLPAFRQPNILPLVVLGGLHFLLALGLMLYFFHVPPMPTAVDVTVAPKVVVPSPASNMTH